MTKAPGASLRCGDSEPEEFPPKNLQFKHGEVDLDLIQYRYQISPEFKLEVSLWSIRVCNPPSNWITLYEEYFEVRLRFPLFNFFIELFKLLRMFLCVVIPNLWDYICDLMVVYLLASV